MTLVRMTLVAVTFALAGSLFGSAMADLAATLLPDPALGPPSALVVVSPAEIARTMDARLFMRNEPAGELRPTPPMTACAPDLRVQAIVGGFGPDGRSYASITHAAGTQILRLGMRVGDYEVRSIRRERVTLARGDDRCDLVLFTSREAVPEPPPTASIATPPSANPALEGGIEAITPTHFRVERRIVRYLLENQAETIGLARVIPQREGDRIVAVKIYGVRRSGLLGRLGFQNGDAIRTVNGYDVSSPDQVLEALVALRDARRLSVSIVRRGEPSTLEYDIAD